MLTAALPTIAKRWEQSQYQLNGWRKTACVHPVEYFQSQKRNKALTHTITWMNIENDMLSETSQTQKTTYRMIPFL